jgi:hypothetical protein
MRLREDVKWSGIGGNLEQISNVFHRMTRRVDYPQLTSCFSSTFEGRLKQKLPSESRIDVVFR